MSSHIPVLNGVRDVPIIFSYTHRIAGESYPHYHIYPYNIGCELSSHLPSIYQVIVYPIISSTPGKAGESVTCFFSR